MSPKPPDWQEQFQASLKRAQEAMAQGLQQQDQIFHSSIESLRQTYPNWGQERWQRRLERKLRKQAEREAKIANASLMEGYLWALAAIALFLVALTNLPFLWWLIFPAVPLFQRGTRVVSRYMKGGQIESQQQQQGQQQGQTFGQQSPFGQQAPFGRSPVQTPAAPTPSITVPHHPLPFQQGAQRPPPPMQWPAPPVRAPEDPRDLRVDSICDRLLAEVKTAPDAARDIFRNPEQTVSSLRGTCRELTRRERELRTFLSPAEDARLSKERETLAARVDSEGDDVAKLRLASALAALDQQRQQRAELAKSANRFEAEHTRIAYTLESLHTQVVRMRSADSSSVDLAGAGLRQSLDMLTSEVDALADALERVNRGDVGRLRSLGDGPGSHDAATPAGSSGSSGPNLREKA